MKSGAVLKTFGHKIEGRPKDISGYTVSEKLFGIMQINGNDIRYCSRKVEVFNNILMKSGAILKTFGHKVKGRPRDIRNTQY
jgi:hypothetical protein